jgi:hypothetical protein
MENRRKRLTWTNAPLVQFRCAERAEKARRRRTPKKAEEASILPFSFAPLSLNVEGRSGNHSRSDTGETAARAPLAGPSP